MRRNRNIAFILVLSLWAGLVFSTSASAADHRLGLGVHYFRSVEDLADDNFDVDEDGLAWLVSYQYVPEGLLHFEIDLEYYPDGFSGASENAFAPTAFILLGRGLYGGVGVGVTFASDLDDNVSDPFYAARLGFRFTLLPGIALDVNANYRADAFNELDQANTDAVTLGALVRFNL